MNFRLMPSRSRRLGRRDQAVATEFGQRGR